MIMIAAVPAAAYYSTVGSGRRVLSTAAAGDSRLTADVLISGPLWPGGRSEVVVHLRNSTSGPVALADITERMLVIHPLGGRTCPASAIGFVPDWTGGLVVPSGGMAFQGALTMTAKAPAGCQGAAISLDLDVRSVS